MSRLSGTPQFFGATELNYLERFFYDRAVEVGKYQLLNGIKPHSANIGMATQITLRNYTDHAFFLLENAVGCDVYAVKKKKKRKKISPVTEKVDKEPEQDVKDQIILFIENKKKDVHAEALLLPDNKLLVRMGSRLSTYSNLMNQKRQAGMEKLRQKLIEEGVVVDSVFTADHEFNSPSTAAAVILGTASSGNELWKDKDGVKLGVIAGKDK